MLFLYRPRETWMPFPRPMSGTPQAAYHRQLHERYESTRRMRPVQPVSEDVSVAGALSRLAELHRSGALSDEEFRAGKAKVLGS